MVKFEMEVVIRRSVEEVFGYIAKGENASRWNSAVQKVEKLSEGPVAVGTEYRMLRSLPSGPAENLYEVVDLEPNRRLTIQTKSGPTPFRYQYVFTPTDHGTRLSL